MSGDSTKKRNWGVDTYSKWDSFDDNDVSALQQQFNRLQNFSEPKVLSIIRRKNAQRTL